MRRFRALALGASTLALVLSACTGTGGGTAQPTTAPASPTTAAKPAAASPISSPAAKPSPAAPAASPATKPAASPAATGPKPAVKIGGANFTEQDVLVELYAQALEASGYRVERKPRIGSREILFPALERGEVDLVPEYLATMESFVAKAASGQSKASTDAAATQKALQDLLTPKNLTVLDFAPAVDQNGFVVSKATADQYGLKKMSDLQPVASQLVLGGPPECPSPDRPFCLAGLEKTYGLKFKDFKPLDSGGPLTVAALDGKQVDVGLLFTTDPAIVSKGYVLLDDDKYLQLSDNIAPVVRNTLLSQAPADLRTALNGVSAKLTTAELTKLNKEVGIDRKEAKDVAGAWLKANNLSR